MRRGLGPGRSLVVIGSLLALIGCFLPWVTAGETQGNVVTSNGLGGVGLVVFLAAIGNLVLVLLPYATPSGRAGIDRPLAYAALTAVLIVGLVARGVQLWEAQVLRLWPPDQALGLWLALVGAVVATVGVGQLLGEKPPPSPLRPLR